MGSSMGIPLATTCGSAKEVPSDRVNDQVPGDKEVGGSGLRMDGVPCFTPFWVGVDRKLVIYVGISMDSAGNP